MKVYVVTYYNNNYGSALQAYALQSKLKELGAEPMIIRPEAKNIGKSLHDKLRFYFRKEKHYGPLRKIRRSIQKRIYATKLKKINAFISGHTVIIPYKEALHSIQIDKCVLLAGSDQIWNTLNHEIDDFYLFREIDNPRARKVSYAASIGVSILTEEQKEYYKVALADFDVVSFRETHALRLLSDSLNNNEVRVDIDPTLLYDACFWEKLLPSKKPELPYLFVYMLRPDRRVIEIARHLAKKHHLNIIYIGLFSNYYRGVKTVVDAGVEDFLYYLYNADIVITNSFHGTVFSLLFHKKFASVRIDSTASRVESLLRTVGLENRLVEGVDDCEYVYHDYNYSEIDKILDDNRRGSINYLRQIVQS